MLFNRLDQQLGQKRLVPLINHNQNVLLLSLPLFLLDLDLLMDQRALDLYQ